MKQLTQAATLSLFLLLLFISHTSARLLPSHPQFAGENPEKKPDEVTLPEDDFSSLMGLEGCGDTDKVGCQKRRLVAAAHLDYIYTQDNIP